MSTSLKEKCFPAQSLETRSEFLIPVRPGKACDRICAQELVNNSSCHTLTKERERDTKGSLYPLSLLYLELKHFLFCPLTFPEVTHRSSQRRRRERVLYQTSREWLWQTYWCAKHLVKDSRDDGSVTLTDFQISSCQIMENLSRVTSRKQEMPSGKNVSHVSHVTEREGQHDEVKRSSSLITQHYQCICF